MLHSIVEYYSQHKGYRCGYCNKPDTNFSHGLWAHAITVTDYQDLIDRGWRRSGKYCYKPTMDVTCCPMYTIRCRALEFKASKSQKKVLKRFNKFLIGNDQPSNLSRTERKMSTCSGETEVTEVGFQGGELFVEPLKDHKKVNITSVVKNDFENLEAGEGYSRGESSGQIDNLKSKVIKANIQKDFKKGVSDPSKAPCKKAKQLRRERKLEKLKVKGIDISTLSNVNKNQEKQIEDFINDLPDNIKQKLEIKLVRTAPPSAEWLASAKESHDIYVKYQTVIHNDRPEKCTETKFKEFLVDSPLLEEHSETGPSFGYGSFHQQYLLNGKIIAVGVIDILPKCVSSVYFFYDPQYTNLTLGTYGALREIAFMRYLHSLCPELKYYYMGYYIHTCTKMRYKGNFTPSDLLCPETYSWFPLAECLPKLEAAPYSRLDINIDSVDENFPRDGDINYIPILVNGVVMAYKNYKRKIAKRKTDDDSEELMEYLQLVGRKVAKNLILVR